MNSDSRTLSPGLLAGFAAILVVLVAALVAGPVNLRKVYGSSEAVAHTQAVKAALQRLLGAAVDAETGQRGFIITGEAGYLEPYDRGRDAISAAIGEVGALTADNPEQLQDLDRLHAAATAKLGELAEAIRQRREAGFAAAQAVVSTDIGQRAMERMREIVARMEAREDALLAARRAQAAESYRAALVTGFVTSGIGLLVVALLFVAARRFGAERQRAEQSAERLSVTLQSIGDAVITTDEQGRVLRLNPVAAALTGWADADAHRRRLEEVFVIVNEHTRRPAENPIGRVLRERVIVGLANHTILIAKDGRETAIDDSAAPIKAADGRIVGAVMVFRDISERRHAERERASLVEAERVARAKAEQANRMKDEFLAMVSHELRTPLNAVLGWADMLRSGILSEPRRARAIEAVYSNAHRQTKLIDELLDISRIMSGKLQLDRAPLDLPSVLRAGVDVLQPAADAKQVHLAIDVDESIGTFHADPARLQQILGNLLSNAIKFTPQGGAVHVRLHRTDRAIELTVADTGQGIPPEFLTSVFEPFRQAEHLTTRRHGGLGLGLSIVRNLVEAHGGTVRAESGGHGKGSTFVVRLPEAAMHADTVEADAAGPARSEASTSAGAARMLHAVSVLVVDDDDDSREMLAATLEYHGAAVHTASSAAEALEMLRHLSVDVLISDIAMPGEDGYSLIRRLRAREAGGSAHLPAAALTSLAREEDRGDALRAGFQVHLVKPIDAPTLVDAVATLAGLRT